MLTLGTATLAVLSCLPIASAPRRRVPAPDRRRRPPLHADHDGRPHRRAGRARRCAGRTRRSAPFGAVATVFGKVGRADTAADPAPLSMVETTVRLLPRSQWPKLARARWYSGWAPGPLRRALGVIWPEETAPTLAELVESLDRAARLPGWSGGWTAPIRARMDMMATGVRTPRRDPDRRGGSRTPRRAGRGGAGLVEGRARHTQRGGRIAGRRDPPGVLHRCAGAGPARRRRRSGSGRGRDLVLTDGQIGDLDQAGRRLRVRHCPPSRTCAASPTEIRAVTVRASRNRAGDDHPPPPVALGLLGHPKAVSRPATIRSEGGELSAYVHVDVAPGTDLRGYVQRAQAALDGDAAARISALAPGEQIESTGQCRLLAAGQRRLDLDRPRGGAVDARLAVPPVPQPDRGADRSRLGAVRAGGEHLDVVRARLPDVRAGVGRPPVGGGPRHADRRGHGRLHRRGVSPPRAGGERSPAATTSLPRTPREPCSACGPS